MNQSYALIALLLTSSATTQIYSQIGAQEVEITEQDIALQTELLSATYDIIDNQCQDTAFQQCKDELNEVYKEYFDTCTTKTTTQEALSAIREKLATCIKNILTYFETHFTTRNELAEMGTPEDMATIVCSVCLIKMAQNYVESTEHDDMATMQCAIQELTQLVFECL